MDRSATSRVADSAVRQRSGVSRVARPAGLRRAAVDPAAMEAASAGIQAARQRIRALARDNARLRAELARLGAAVARVEELAYHDELTGLPNRALLGDRLNRAIALASRDSVRVAVLLLDLDRFKQVNDGLGHAAGDRLLVEVARRLSATVRLSDTVARYGGDEFVVMLPRVDDGRSVGRVTRKLRERLEMPVWIDGVRVTIGASIGIAIHPCDGATAAELLEKADARMYRHKARLGTPARPGERGRGSERPDDQDQRQAGRDDQHL